MSIVFASLPTFAFLLLCLDPIDAYASDWLVSRTTSQVTYAADRKAWLPVKEGMAVPNRAWVSTGPRGRVMLKRGAESISVGPDTLVAIWTKGGLLSVKTNIIQQKGEIALDIEKRQRPHTYVHTPFLAAVVKGTSFTVTVTWKNASVAVDRGLVQVSSFTGGESTNIGPGQQATVDDAQTMSVNGIGSTVPSVVSVEPTRALVPAFGRRAPIGTGLGLPSFNGRGPAAGGTGRSDPAASNSVPGESSESGEHRTSWNNSAGATRDANDDGGGSSGGGSGNGSGGTVSDGSSSGGSGGSGSGSGSSSGSSGGSSSSGDSSSGGSSGGDSSSGGSSGGDSSSGGSSGGDSSSGGSSGDDDGDDDDDDDDDDGDDNDD